jgi:hypothetical protein
VFPVTQPTTSSPHGAEAASGRLLRSPVGRDRRPGAASTVRRARLAAALWAACAAALLAAGCGEEPGPPRLNFHLRSRAELERVRRVVLMNLSDEAAQPDIAAGMTGALYRALQDRRLFHVELLRGGHPAESLLQKGPQGPYSLEELADIRDALQCDAVLVGSLTAFQPYPRMQIGLVLRLLDLRSAKAVWSVDLVWDARDKDVQAALRRYFRDYVGREYQPLDWQIGTISPDAFEKFVAHEVVRTLPDGARTAAPTPREKR